MAKPKIPKREVLVAVAEVCTLFRTLMRNGECDLLCRMASHTRAVYGDVADSATNGDTPEKLNNRVRFIRDYKDTVRDATMDWENFIDSRPKRKKPYKPEVLWMCVRCGHKNCSGAICAQIVENPSLIE